MTELTILGAMQHMLLVTLFGVCVLTVPALIVGVIVSILQAATQINEMTMTFIPKLIVMFILLFTLTPWLMHHLVNLTQGLFFNLPHYIR